VSVTPTQILHGLGWNQTETSMVTGQQLTPQP